MVSTLAAIECLVCGLISKHEFNEHNICGAMFAHGRHCIAWMKSRINDKKTLQMLTGVAALFVLPSISRML